MKTHQVMKVAVTLACVVGVQHSTAAPPPLQAQLKAASPMEMVDLQVDVPLRHQAQLDDLLVRLHDPNSPQYQQWLTPADFLRRFGPDRADLARVRASLVARGFTLVDGDAHGMHVRGPAGAVAATFATEVRKLTQQGRQRFVAQRQLQVPNELQGMNLRILGLESLPKRRVHSHVVGKVADATVDNRYGVAGPYWFDDLKQAYDYPSYSHYTDGRGVSVAVLMADLIFPDDVAAAFNHEQFPAITGRPVPSVATRLVDGGGVQDGYGSFEASLDVQQVLGGAPGSKVTLVSIPDLSDVHIADGYRYIVDTNAYDIVNSSFGGCELEYTAAYNGGVDYTYILKTLHEIFQQGNAQGITFVASSGDEGGLECPTPDYGSAGATPVFVPGVSNPADDPDVTAVGGGNLITTQAPGVLDSRYVRESAFGDPQAPYDIYGLGQDVSGGYWGAGGGVSAVFAKPPYQYLAQTGSRKWRTVPDVGMQVGGLGFSGAGCNGLSCGADDSSVLTAYGVGLGGGYYYTIGTSVSSPEFVGALAVFEQKLGKHHRVGNINYFLYAKGAIQSLAGGAHAPSALQYFHRNIPGNDGYWNGGYPSQNYDYIYGNGSPDVRKLFDVTSYPPAGTPQTPSNP